MKSPELAYQLGGPTTDDQQLSDWVAPSHQWASTLDRAQLLAQIEHPSNASPHKPHTTGSVAQLAWGRHRCKLTSVVLVVSKDRVSQLPFPLGADVKIVTTAQSATNAVQMVHACLLCRDRSFTNSACISAEQHRLGPLYH